MSSSRGRGHDADARGLEAAPEAMRKTDDGFEISIRLTNPLNRAVHYVADVRGMIFDPATKRLRVLMSDQGFEVVPGGVAVQPRFASVDPQSEAVATIRLPKTIVKLAETPSPPGEVLFEEHAIADAEAVDVEIGWADTPYYADPREKSRGAAPVSAWEQHAVHVTVTPPGAGKKGS
jgi:hypothetical protein